MLKKLASVKNVGLLTNARWTGHPLGRTNLIYADNGRGKSTLCTILRSASSGKADPIERRTTIDASDSPSVDLEFDQNHHVTYSSGAWSQVRPEILVFDTTFVRSTVHSGGLVTADHRRNLLQFALGTAAVAAQGRLDAANTDEVQSKKSREAANALLKQHSGRMSVTEFIGLPDDPEIGAKIAKTEEHLTHARRKSEILQRPVGEPLPAFALDLERLFDVIGRDLSTLHDRAASATMVDEHLRRLHDDDAEAWVRRGVELHRGDECPFCAQPTSGLPLLEAYRQYFDAAYAALADDLSAVASELEAALSDASVTAILAHVETQKSTFASWKDHVDLPELTIDEAKLVRQVGEVRAQVRTLVSAKRAALGSSLDERQRRVAATQARSSVVEVVRAVNKAIDSNVAAIRAYQQELGDTATESIETELERLRSVRARYSEPVLRIAAELKAAEVTLADAGVRKKVSREELAEAMSTTLSKYRNGTNDLLAQLGARFRIPDMPTTWVGGGLGQTEYVLELRGRQIKPNDKDQGLSFDIALSDGDKRTLALAFFLASVRADPAVADKIVVFDDPVCSLDRGRRETTVMAIDELSADVGQLIVMSHDAHLLRELRRLLKRRHPGIHPTVAGLGISGDDYSDFEAIDLDRVCESPYMRNFRTVDLFCSQPTEDTRFAAGEALRLLLEGYLHRRFPGLIASDVMLGQAINQIDQAPPSSRLVHAADLVSELRRINSFAGQFHHDTNPDLQTATTPPASTILQFARDTLDLVTGAPAAIGN